MRHVLVFLPAGAGMAAPPLQPWRRSVETRPGELALPARVLARVAPDPPANRFALGTLSAKLERISSTNGFVQDLRGAILELKQEYRAAWPAENRPYWLDNVLVRYDAESLYWQQKANLFGRLIEEFQMTGELPLPEQLGLVLPE